MAVPAGQWSPRRRVGVILLMVGLVVVITSASAYMISEVDRTWSPGSVVRTVLGGIMVVVSGMCVNFLPRAVVLIWRSPERLPRIGDLGWLVRALKRPLRLVVLLLTVVVIVAAGVLATPPSTAVEPGPLVVMTAFGESENDPRSILFDQWNQSHPDNPVRVSSAPGETDQQHERMVNDAKSGGDRTADVYVLDNVWMAQFVDRGYIRELDRASVSEADLGDFIPKVLDTCRRDGKLWALPFNTDAGLIYYRTDVPGVGKPETWDDYFGQSAKAKAAVAKAGPYGIKAANAAQLADEEVLTVTALIAMWAAGGEMVPNTGEVSMNGDRSEVYLGKEDLKGIENLAAASKDPDVVLTENDEAAKSAENGAVEAFKSGRTLYMGNWPVAQDKLRKGVEFAIAAPPSPGVLGGQNLAISATSAKPKAARELIEFLTSRSSQLILSEIGAFAPTRQSTFTYSKRPDIQELRTAIDGARLRPVTPNYTEFSRVFRKGILRALNNGGKPEPGFTRELAAALKG